MIFSAPGRPVSGGRQRPRLRIALGYPNSYEVGISNLGFQTVYRLFNQEESVSCERFFFEKELKEGSCYTLETGGSLTSFDVIAFSISYELDLIHALRLIKEVNLPLLARDRENENFPLLMAGGIAPTLNPEPFAPLFDLLFIGEAESFIHDFVRVFLGKGKRDKEELLTELSQLEGVYVPKLYSVGYDHRGGQRSFVARGKARARVRRALDLGVEEHPAYSPVISDLSHFKNTFLIEVGRGCPHHCRFCAARAVYSPTRFSPPETVLNVIEDHNAGAGKVGLVGTLLSDYPGLGILCSDIVKRGFGLGLSSFRADKISFEILKYLTRASERTLTIAPEVGEEKLRLAIGKKIRDEEIFKGAQLANRAGIRRLRLYFMVGLPGETADDMKAIVELVEKIKRDHFRGNVRISLAPFIPKPWTPFMYAPYSPRGDLERKIRLLKSRFGRLSGVSFQAQGLRSSEVSAMISVGTRLVGEALADFVSTGKSLKSLLKSKGVEMEALLYTERSPQDLFPWDFIDLGADKKRLYGIYKKKAD